MTFDPKRKAGRYIAVDVPAPFTLKLRDAKYVDISAPSVDVSELKRQWSEGQSESFVAWAENAPDEVFLRWTEGVHQAQMKECWKASSESASRVIHNIATNFDTSPAREVKMEELLTNEGYLKLDVPSQWTARYAIEHLQRQTASGEWTLSQHRK